MVLPKSMRIKGYKCFNYIHKKADRYNSHLMLLKVVEAKPRLLKVRNKSLRQSNLRFALSISNKVSKKAVVRNQLRRALHDHIKKRFENKANHQAKWILISLKPDSINKSLLDVKNECDKLLSRAGFYYD